MKKYIRKFKDQDIINRIQNKFFIRIGLFNSLISSYEIETRHIETNYSKKQLNINDKKLLSNYANKYRGKHHYQKNILPRLQNENRFKAFAVIDQVENEIAYLSWIDLENITIPEINYNNQLDNTKAYFLDDHCVKHHQRKGLHNTVFDERLLYCRETGINEVFIVIYLNNSRALQNLKKYHFILINKFIFYPLLRK